jgi:hypothetical protein
MTAAASSRPPRTPEPASGLSTGAKTGIGVGVPVAVLLGLLVFFFAWRNRVKSRKGAAPYEIGGNGVGENGVHEKYASTVPAAPAYVQGNEAQGVVHELQSESVVLELPGAGTMGKT